MEWKYNNLFKMLSLIRLFMLLLIFLMLIVKTNVAFCILLIGFLIVLFFLFSLDFKIISKK